MKKGFRVVKGVPVYLDYKPAHGPITLPLPGADPATFQAIDQPHDARVLYARDAKSVYIAQWRQVQKLNDIDAATFQVLTPDGLFSRDSKHVFYQGVPLDKADPQTFQVVEGVFGKDAERAYLGTVPIPVEQFATWRPFQPGRVEDPWYRSTHDTHPLDHTKLFTAGWSGDATRMYYGNRPVADADPATFILLSEYYSKDRTNVYIAGDVIVSADPKTFEVHDGPYIRGTKFYSGPGPDAHDAKQSYKDGKLFPR